MFNEADLETSWMLSQTVKIPLRMNMQTSQKKLDGDVIDVNSRLKVKWAD